MLTRLRECPGLAVHYELAHGLVTVGVLIGLYLLRPGAYRRARRALVAVNVVALAVFLLMPVTPPRLLPGGGVPDIVARSGTWGAWSTGSTVAAHANLYASLPSLHVAWAAWVGCAVWSATDRRPARAAAAVHLLLTVAVVLLTGNHYLADVAAGGLLTAAVWALSELCPRPWCQRLAGWRLCSSLPRSTSTATTAASSPSPT